MTEEIMEEDDLVTIISSKSGSSKDTLPWVEKYRPNSLSELIAHEEIIQICKKDNTLSQKCPWRFIFL